MRDVGNGVGSSSSFGEGYREMKNVTRRVLVCVDDTDDLTKETSTGEVAEAIAGEVVALGGTLELGITRHQLLVADNVPYTSHNSAMVLVARMPQESVAAFWDAAAARVRGMMSAAADPGLCLAVIPEDGEGKELLYELIAFGQRCKAEYVSKAEAYELAGRIPWVRLEEVGGDGQGVVGALAGAGLRLGGNDGRFRGRWNTRDVVRGVNAGGGKKKGAGGGSGGGKGCGRREAAQATPEGFCTVGQVLDGLALLIGGRAVVVDQDGCSLPENTVMAHSDRVKPVCYAGQFAIVTRMGDNGVAVPCDKAELEELHGSFADMDRTCPAFQRDNDMEEALSHGVESCPNCLYRRWTASGFTCMR